MLLLPRRAAEDFFFQHEWDTLGFENEEMVREEFMESREVIRDEMINEVSGEPEEFYYPDGTWFPPTGRARKQLITYTVIAAVNCATIFISIIMWKDIALPMMSTDAVLAGSIVYGLASAFISVSRHSQPPFSLFFCERSPMSPLVS